MENSLKLQLFGRFSIVEQLDEGYQISRIKHNEEVIKSQPILSTIIKFYKIIKFCRAFELALGGHKESDNPGYSVVWWTLLPHWMC